MNIGELEEKVLIAIERLGDEAYGVPIRAAFAQLGRPISVGALYATLDRLETKGLIEGRTGESTPQRGGRAKRYFRLSGLGAQALCEAETMRRDLRDLKLVGGML